LRLIFSGGGTGGHIYPAIAVALEIRDSHPEADILFVGANGKLEMLKVPHAGFKIIGLWISGLQRKIALSNLLVPLKMLISTLKSRKILRNFNPHVVAGFGGYASGPIMLAASGMGIKTLIQEQNSYAGIANKAVAKKADKICVAYENMSRFFPQDKIVITGNPVRSDLINPSRKTHEAFEYFDIDPNEQTILVMGGSMGARSINEGIIQNIDRWIASGKQLLWQTGRIYFDEMLSRIPQGDLKNIKVLEFIDRMDLAYSASDIVISRAGALSISELCLVGKPVIFVPSPNVAEDHQTKNATALLNENAAIVVRDDKVLEELPEVAFGLLDNHEQQLMLSRNISVLAKPAATQKIAGEILSLASKTHDS